MPKNFEAALKIAGVEKLRSEKLAVVVNLAAI